MTDGIMARRHGAQTLNGSKNRMDPLEFIWTHDFFSDEEGNGAVILYSNERLEVLTFQEMKEKDLYPSLIEYLQNEYLQLFSKGEAWPQCNRPSFEDDFADLDRELQRFIHAHVEFIDDDYCGLLSHWVIVSYLPELVSHFPRLVFYGPTHSGKSRALLILSILAYRGDNAVNSTGPATFRDIEERHLSSIIDEYQKLSKERRPDMDSIFIAGFDKSGCVKRVGDDGTVHRYWPWGPMAVGYKGGKLPEDMENRAILINMAQKTRDDVARRVDHAAAKALRTRLMALRYKILRNTDAFKKCYEKAWEIAEKPFLTDVGEIELDDRTIDMAANIIVGSLIIEGRDIDIEDDLRLLTASQIKAKDSLRDSFEGQAFHALLEVLVHSRGKGALDEEEDITDISTTDVADQLNNDLVEQGNNRHEAIKTVRVGNALREMNFETKQGAQNKSYFVQVKDRNGKDTKFYPTLWRNLRKYGHGALDLRDRPKGELSEAKG